MGSNAMYHENKALQLAEILEGARAVSEFYVIGDTCEQGHGMDGKAVRYKNGSCVLCCAAYKARWKMKKHADKYRDLSALRDFEERQDKEDDDPLFD